MVACKNNAVSGRLFCFTCAGRKSRNKKTLALETSEQRVKLLREELDVLKPELVWKSLSYLRYISISFIVGALETIGNAASRFSPKGTII